MQKTMIFTAALLLLSGCATHANKCDDKEHGSDEVQKVGHLESTVLKYQNYYFSAETPQQLTDFVRTHQINLVIDLREDSTDSETLSEYPAVYWHHAVENLASLTYKKIDLLEKHIDTFSEKNILFVSKNGDVAITAFLQYWAGAHSLNIGWVNKMAAQFGVKDYAWVKKWQELEESADHDRQSASEEE